MGKQEHSLIDDFLRCFDVALATTEEQKKATYRVRYHVYCEEFGYEPGERFPGEEETDEYDDHSLACLITHKPSGMPAGCVRLIPALDHEPLPLEKYCSGSLDTAFIEALKLQRSTLCEISRLAVDGAFRRRAGESVTRFGKVETTRCGPQERRTYPLIAIAAFLASTALTEVSGRTNVLAMMEPFLPRLLKRSGIAFQRVGEDIEYHGRRAPFFITTQHALQNMKPGLRELYDVIHDGVRRDYKGHEWAAWPDQERGTQPRQGLSTGARGGSPPLR